jgi:hypothetical protein
MILISRSLPGGPPVGLSKITKLSKADPMYKLGKYGEHLGNLNKLQKKIKDFEEKNG